MGKGHHNKVDELNLIILSSSRRLSKSRRARHHPWILGGETNTVHHFWETSHYHRWQWSPPQHCHKQPWSHLSRWYPNQVFWVLGQFNNACCLRSNARLVIFFPLKSSSFLCHRKFFFSSSTSMCNSPNYPRLLIKFVLLSWMRVSKVSRVSPSRRGTRTCLMTLPVSTPESTQE